MMEQILPGADAAGAEVVDMDSDRSVHILIKHCREMKQQETRLRFITLLLLLCAGLFCMGFALKQNFQLSGQSGTEQSLAYSEQRLCSTDNPQKKIQTLQNHRWHIHLKSLYEDNISTQQYIKWKVMFGEGYDSEKRAIAVTEKGVYFVYVKFYLSCHNEKGPAIFRKFIIELHKTNEGYGKVVPLTNDGDGITCPSDELRTVVVEDLVELLDGDYVSVWIVEGYELITKSSLGAFSV